MFGESRTGTSEPLMKQQRVLVYEPQGNEFGEAAGFRLDVAQQAHLAHPMIRRFRVSVHHGRGAADAALMRSADDFDPLCCRELVGRQDMTDFIIQNFCSGSWQ